MKRLHTAKIVLIRAIGAVGLIGALGVVGAIAPLSDWTFARPALAQESPRTAAAPDAFYLSLLRDGRAEMLRGDALAARKSFRLACFGFLEQPVVLAEGLVRLGLAEAALGDREAFVATFARLTEVEERFAAYAPAALSAEERRVFEGRALEWVTPEVLRSLPSFAPLLARKTEVDLAKLSPRERTRELEKRRAAEPANPKEKTPVKKAGSPALPPAPGPTPPEPSAALVREPAAAPRIASPAPTGSKPAPGKLSAAEERIVADARGMLKAVEDRAELRLGLALVQPVADRLPERGDLQLLAGEIAYRAGLWTTGADYFRRSTPDRKGPTDPTLRFYYAVCLYEAGDRSGASAVAATGLEKLARPPFVEAYLAKFRAAAP